MAHLELPGNGLGELPVEVGCGNASPAPMSRTPLEGPVHNEFLLVLEDRIGNDSVELSIDLLR